MSETAAAESFLSESPFGGDHERRPPPFLRAVGEDSAVAAAVAEVAEAAGSQKAVPAAPLAAAAAATGAAAATVATVPASQGGIVAGTTLVGDIVVKGGEDLVIEGRLLGDIYHDGGVIIAEGGIVIGDVVAKSLVVRGKLKGPHADSRCIVGHFHVDGTGSVHTERVKMAAGQMIWSSTGQMNTRVEMVPAEDSAAEVTSSIEAKLAEMHDKFAAAEGAAD